MIRKQTPHPCLNFFIPNSHYLNVGIYSAPYSIITTTPTHFAHWSLGLNPRLNLFTQVLHHIALYHATTTSFFHQAMTSMCAWYWSFGAKPPTWTQSLYPSPPPPQPGHLQHPMPFSCHHSNSFHLPGDTKHTHLVLTIWGQTSHPQLNLADLATHHLDSHGGCWRGNKEWFMSLLAMMRCPHD